MATISDPQARRLLDAVDVAKRALAAFDATPLTPPSVVVVGMQAAGKSSLLSRIADVPFPHGTHDGACTRVAYELTLRRCDAHEAPSTKVLAHKAALSDFVSKERLEYAQSLVLQGQSYDCHHKVHVVKADAYLPEAILVDLPGVPYEHCKSVSHQEDRDVLDLLRTYMEPEHGLILHVVPLNKPLEAIRSWDLVRQMDPSLDRTLNIFTMGDLSDDCPDAEYIAATLIPRDLLVPSEAILILDHDDDATEGLHTLLNERMLQYVMDMSLPALERQIQVHLGTCASTLAKLEQQSFRLGLLMAREVHDVAQSIRTIFDAFLPELRVSMERVVHDILAWEMTPFGSIQSLDDRRLDLAAFESLGKLSGDAALLLDLVVEVKEMTFRSRGVANESFHHPRMPLQKWTEVFATHTHSIMRTFVDELFGLFHDELRASVHGNERYTDSMRHIGLRTLLNALQATKARATTVVENIRDWNLGPDLYTTNTEALAAASRPSDAEASLLAQAVDTRPQWAPHFEALFHIRGFLRVQQHLVGDAMQREILRLLRGFMADVERLLHECMDEMMSETEKSQRRPPTAEMGAIGRRNEWLARQQALYEALAGLGRYLPPVTVVSGRDPSEIKRRRMV
ncbi:hypothetical protein SPRG_08624 [Saprolegnia parasitica CBS 223.65]|uniref:Dynamin GTPase domain-containing protein n=1 Tax=Saprolegnia parasitica (strain CBS 223.65) TaxID=695850 RepID=A0A067CHD9_SAPPC|nr:hypothetical protein SPRG_08624 [Saprolegnia parasitica CBS 223.65]KDO25971.1 hypothetical protein SPRG_08624 [Saprolegnia parasitica CBS 223.65]|eukprot:XP_012203258.1 hypothetical protein SPRG_08624 [Saprolegnia parasitica CBS 223.65]